VDALSFTMRDWDASRKEQTDLDPSKFDDLTKSLATSTSRRKAFRRIGGILGGTALASLLPGRALANGGGNSDCAHLCNEIFGADTPEADLCIITAAHNGFTCFQCFTAGTLVAMADGTSRPIEHIRVEDLVLGNTGRVNRVTQVLLPLLGHRSLYSLNGSNFFVTAGHPFMTEEGWKAIDPAATPAEHAGLHVGRLTVGDRLLTLTAAAVPIGAGRAINAEAVDVRIEAIELHSLVGQAADPATQLYNLRLDGNHTYFANDLLVHNK